MRRERRPSLEFLEGRKLLSAAHAAAGHPVKAEVAPLNLDGVLAVDSKATSETYDMYGDYFYSTPVTGTLGTMGKVRGTLNEEQLYTGAGTDVDTLQLKNASGAVTLSFGTAAKGKVHKTAAGASFNPVAQHASGSSGDYAHAVEKGKVLFNTDKAGKTVESITVTTDPA